MCIRDRSIHDAGNIFNQEVAMKYMATLTKGKTMAHILEILMDYFLPHIGENNFINKAYYLGYMVNELLKVYKGEKKATDRDSFKYKRVELSGSLIYDLFKEYYSLQQKHIYTKIDKEYYLFFVPSHAPITYSTLKPVPDQVRRPMEVHWHKKCVQQLRKFGQTQI